MVTWLYMTTWLYSPVLIIKLGTHVNTVVIFPVLRGSFEYAHKRTLNWQPFMNRVYTATHIVNGTYIFCYAFQIWANI